jgi:glycosyltransferase involved in cell wall biosynthesis
LAPTPETPPDPRRSAANDLISVIIPVRNGEQFVERTLESVLRQTYKEIEVIVVDDGSTDRTAAIVKNAAARDKRVILLSGPQAGVSGARNRAISHARGDFIAPLDADDLWHRDKLALQMDAIRRGGAQVGLAYCWSVAIDANDSIFSGSVSKFLHEGKVLNTLVERNFLGNGSTPLVRRACLEAVGGYDPRFFEARAQGAEDWQFYLSLAAISEFVVVRRCLVGYRQTATNLSADFSRMQRSIDLVREFAHEQWSSVPTEHWKRERYYTNHYLANLALQAGSIGNAAAFHLRSIAAWPPSLMSVPTTKIGIRLLAALIGLDLRRLRQTSTRFEQFSDCLTIDRQSSHKRNTTKAF